jgi:predicted transposase YdaD
MSKRFDAILKHLPEEYPQDWALLAGVKPSTPVTVIDADLSTVTAAADNVLRVDEPKRWILHLEFQASYDRTLSERILQYNVLLRVCHSLPMRSAVILLRPEADGKTMTGHFQEWLSNGATYLEFR